MVGVEDRVEDLDNRDTARLEMCFSALCGIPLGPGSLPNIRPMMAA
jgi:hypothetical protein